MLLVLVPVSHIFASIRMLVYTEALCHIIHEFSFVKITTGMIKLTTAIVEIVLPETFIDSSIRPPHDTVPLFDVWRVFQHLPRIDSAFLAPLVDILVVNIHKVAGFILLHLFVGYVIAII